MFFPVGEKRRVVRIESVGTGVESNLPTLAAASADAVVLASSALRTPHSALRIPHSYFFRGSMV